MTKLLIALAFTMVFIVLVIGGRYLVEAVFCLRTRGFTILIVALITIIYICFYFIIP